MSTKLQEDIEILQKEKESKIEEVNEKEKTITQLRRIGRRYKIQCDELAKEKEDLERRLSEEKPSEDSTEQGEIVKTLTEEKKNLQGELEKFTQTMTASKEKEEKSKKTLTSATKRIQQLTSLNDKYLNESEEVKKILEEVRQEKNALLQTATEREMRLTVLSTQFEGKQLRIEKEIKEKNEELEKYIQEKTKLREREAIKERENETLKKCIQQYKRLMLQAQQKLKSQASLRVAATQGQSVTSGASTSTGMENTSKELVTSQSTVPPTAAIKPTATPACTSVPVRPTSTPTASIRPMTTATVQPTPTATVPPTVTTQPTAVAIVSAVNEPITATSVALRSQASASTSVQAPVTPLVSTVLPSVLSEVTSSPSVSVRPITSSNVSTIIAMATSSMEVNEERPAGVVISSEERPSAFYTRFDTIHQSEVSKVASSQRESVDSPQLHGSKRARDYASSVETIREEQESKKPRTETEQELEDEVCEEDVEDGNAADDEDVLDSAEEHESEPEIICINVDSDEDDADKDDVMETEIIEEDDEEEEDDDDVIREVVDDDIDIREEFDDEGISEEPDVSVQEEISDNVAVVCVTADSTPSTSNQEVRCQETAVTSHTVPAMAQIPLLRSQSHLAPFTLSQGQAGSTAFDDTDDCMVPSTPTLFIPKRSDGFGEMISSPRVHHPSFLFGSTADTQTGGLAMGMSEEGLRVDDTRFDIMASSGDGDEPDLGFDNVVPDLDEAAAIEFSTEDDGGESSSVLSSMVSSTSAEQSKPQSVDISEQNVPETSEKYDMIEIPELAEGEEEEDGSKVQDDDGETSSNINIELQTVDEENEDESVLEIKSSEDDSFPDPSAEVYSTPEPPSSTSGVGVPIPTSQEARLKGNVVQLRRPAGQATAQVAGIQIPGVQSQTGRRFIRRVQARGQSPGPRGRGRGGQ